MKPLPSQTASRRCWNAPAFRRSILLHGENATVWPFVERAAARKLSTRVGLEDGKELPDASVAEGNAALVAAAVAIYRAR